MNEGFEKITKLREEVDRLKTEEEQAGHQAVRYENKIDNLEKKERTKRTHLLCSKAGYIESIFPVIKDSSKTDFIQFCEGLVRIPGVMEYAKHFKPEPIGEVMK